MAENYGFVPQVLQDEESLVELERGHHDQEAVINYLNDSEGTVPHLRPFPDPAGRRRRPRSRSFTPLDMANNVPPYENSVPKNWFERMGLACYPPGYNYKVHGSYQPTVYYGPKDNLADVKMRDLLQWIGRRDKSPIAFAQMMSRGYFRWMEKFAGARKSGISFLVQLAVMSSFLSYCSLWKTLQHHKNHKYHW